MPGNPPTRSGPGDNDSCRIQRKVRARLLWGARVPGGHTLCRRRRRRRHCHRRRRRPRRQSIGNIQIVITVIVIEMPAGSACRPICRPSTGRKLLRTPVFTQIRFGPTTVGASRFNPHTLPPPPQKIPAPNTAAVSSYTNCFLFTPDQMPFLTHSLSPSHSLPPSRKFVTSRLQALCGSPDPSSTHKQALPCHYRHYCVVRPRRRLFGSTADFLTAVRVLFTRGFCFSFQTKRVDVNVIIAYVFNRSRCMNWVSCRGRGPYELCASGANFKSVPKSSSERFNKRQYTIQ